MAVSVVGGAVVGAGSGAGIEVVDAATVSVGPRSRLPRGLRSSNRP
jgi:hypothetical protein